MDSTQSLVPGLYGRTSPWYKLSCTEGGCRIPPESRNPNSVRAWIDHVLVPGQAVSLMHSLPVHCRFHLVCPGIKFGDGKFFWAWYKMKVKQGDYSLLYFHFVPILYFHFVPSNLLALLSFCTKPRKIFSRQILSLDKPSGIDNNTPKKNGVTGWYKSRRRRYGGSGIPGPPPVQPGGQVRAGWVRGAL